MAALGTRTAQRNQEIIHAYATRVPQPTNGELAREFGLALSSVKNLLSKAGAKSRKEKGELGGLRHPHTYTDKRPIDRLRQQIGVALNAYRCFDLNAKSAEVAEALCMTVKHLTKIEMGLHDLTISELIRISNFLNIPLPVLMTEKDLVKGSE